MKNKTKIIITILLIAFMLCSMATSCKCDNCNENGIPFPTLSNEEIPDLTPAPTLYNEPLLLTPSPEAIK